MLSEYEKELLVIIWDKMIPIAEEIGSEALLRPVLKQADDRSMVNVCKVRGTEVACCPAKVYYFLCTIVIHRMFTTFPKTKTYFAHLDITPRSKHLLSHGKKIVYALHEGAKYINTLTTTLAPLSRFHAYQLRIDPTNFKLLSHCMLVTLACHMKDEFTPVAHAAMDKYLSAFSAVLAEKYR